MSATDKTAQIALLRKLQFIGPISMVVIAALIYTFWKNDLAIYVAMAIAVFGVIDLFVFKFLADHLENS